MSGKIHLKDNVTVVIIIVVIIIIIIIIIAIIIIVIIIIIKSNKYLIPLSPCIEVAVWSQSKLLY